MEGTDDGRGELAERREIDGDVKIGHMPRFMLRTMSTLMRPFLGALHLPFRCVAPRG